MQTAAQAAAAHASTGVALLASQGPEAHAPAQACFLEALKLDRSNGAAWLGLGRVFMEQGQARLAAPCYQEALQHLPGSCEVLLALGRCLLAAGRPKEATPYLYLAAQQEQQERPATTGTLASLADAYYACGEFSRAVPLYHKLVLSLSTAGPPPAEALNNLGNALRGAGRLLEAAQCYDKVCRQLLQSLPPHLHGTEPPTTAAAGPAAQQQPSLVADTTPLATAHGPGPPVAAGTGTGLSGEDSLATEPWGLLSPGHGGGVSITAPGGPSAAAHPTLQQGAAAATDPAAPPGAAGAQAPALLDLSWVERTGALLEQQQQQQQQGQQQQASSAGLPPPASAGPSIGPGSTALAGLPGAPLTGLEGVDPRLGLAVSNLGDVFRLQGNHPTALSCYRLAAALQPRAAAAWCRVGSEYRDLARYGEAARAYGTAVALDPGNKEAFAGLVQTKQSVCDWSDRSRLMRLLQRQVESDLASGCMPQVQPFHAMTLPFSPQLTLAVAEAHARQAMAQVVQQEVAMRAGHAEGAAAGLGLALQGGLLPPLPHPPPLPRPDRLRIGYVSSDFCNHPLGQLMCSVFALHDRAHFAIYLYATSPDDGSALRRRIQQAATTQSREGGFFDVSALSDAELARRMSADALHVAIDLNGFTRGSRPGVFARRPAPVQASFMGFPASSGAPYMAYYIADATVVPPLQQQGQPQGQQQGQQHMGQLQTKQHAGGGTPPVREFSECIVRLPHSYFVNDYRQAHAQVPDLGCTAALRASEGLPPPPAVLYCCFNQLYKLDPTTLAIWCRVLTRVPGSVLWLLRFPSEGEPNVRAAAAAALPGGEEEAGRRIVFTDVAPKQRHLERCALADVFLDTPEVCGAHTTACDALWAGCPVVTAPGRRMAGRVACSLAAATGLGPEMVAADMQGYEELAVSLGLDCARRQALRGRLAEARHHCPLFDTARWVRGLERGLRLMWEQHCSGAGPTDIWVPDEG